MHWKKLWTWLSSLFILPWISVSCFALKKTAKSAIAIQKGGKVKRENWPVWINLKIVIRVANILNTRTHCFLEIFVTEQSSPNRQHLAANGVVAEQLMTKAKNREKKKFGENSVANCFSPWNKSFSREKKVPAWPLSISQFRVQWIVSAATSSGPGPQRCETAIWPANVWLKLK